MHSFIFSYHNQNKFSVYKKQAYLLPSQKYTATATPRMLDIGFPRFSYMKKMLKIFTLQMVSILIEKRNATFLQLQLSAFVKKKKKIRVFQHQNGRFSKLSSHIIRQWFDFLLVQPIQ